MHATVQVLPKRPPPPPDWPPLTAPPDAAADVPRSSAELAQPFSSADAAAQLAPGAADNSEDNTAATAIAVAVFVAAVLAIALCAAAAIARQRRRAQEAEKGSEAAAAGGMMAGGAVGGAKPRDEGARQVAKLSRQLDLFNEDDLFMGQYEVLGRDRSSLGSAPPPTVLTTSVVRGLRCSAATARRVCGCACARACCVPPLQRLVVAA